MSATGELGRLEAIIDASGVPARIEALLPAGIRPRQLRIRTLLLAILLALADKRPGQLSRAHEALIGLPEKDKRRLGVIAQWKQGPHQLTYRQLEYTFMRVVRALSKEKPDGAPSEILSEVLDNLLEGSVEVLGGERAPQSSSYAIDWSDCESFARAPRKKAAKPAEQAAEAPQQDEQQDAEGQEAQSSHDGCADSEAAWGHRKVNTPGKSEMFYGCYLQAVTNVGEEKGPQVPELVARIQIASPKHDPPAMITPVIERMHKQGIEIGDLLADSGYSYREPETFAAPMRSAGAKLVMDLHPNDRGVKGTHMGAIICNGNLYCPATPQALLTLGPLAPAAGAEQTEEHDRQSAELSRHKLSAISSPDQDGYHRVICPAAAGKIRCPTRTESMSLPCDRPTIPGAPEHPPTCCTQKTITVPPSVNAKTAQKHDYRHETARRRVVRFGS